MNIPNGKYVAKIIDYTVNADEGKTPNIEVRFSFVVDGSETEWSWYGYVTEKAMKTTMRALVAMGLSTPDLDRLADGVESNILDHLTPVVIDVENETYEGKTRSKIRWVNKMGGRSFERLAPTQAKAAVSPFKGFAAAFLAENGIKPVKRQPVASDTSDIPF
jgi:hypothetical protein